MYLHFYNCICILQKESSVPREDVKNKANLGELHSPNCSNIEQRKRKLVSLSIEITIFYSKYKGWKR